MQTQLSVRAEALSADNCEEKTVARSSHQSSVCFGRKDAGWQHRDGGAAIQKSVANSEHGRRAVDG